MNRLSLVKKFTQAEAVTHVGSFFLVKKEGRLQVVSDLDFALVGETEETHTATKIVVSLDGKYALLLTPLFSDKAVLYRLDPFGDKTFAFEDKDTSFKDGCFSADGQKLYLLSDTLNGEEVESRLTVITLPGFHKETFFKGKKMFYDSLRYSRDTATLSLLDRRGSIAFFSDKKIIRRVVLPPFRKLYFFDHGEIITDSLFGVTIVSRNGKLIRKADFLLPQKRPVSDISENDLLSQQERNLFVLAKNPPALAGLGYRESYLDFSLDKEKGLLFFLSQVRPEKNGNLYVLSLTDFSLVQTIHLHNTVSSLSAFGGYLSVRFDSGVSVYRING